MPEPQGFLPDQMELIACPLCGGRHYKKLFDAADIKHGVPGRFTFVRCASCRLIFQNPRIKNEFRNRMYPPEYEPYHCGKCSLFHDSARLASTIPRFEILEKYHAQPGRLVDVGSGAGDFVVYAASRGWDAWGMEPSAPQHENQDTTAPRVIRSELTRADFPDDHFDAITFWASLEHMHDPLAALRTAHRILKQHGLVILSLPNGDSLERRVFGAMWFGLDTPRHLVLPSPAAARRFLETAGFRILELRHATTATCFIESVRAVKRKGMPAPEPPQDTGMHSSNAARPGLRKHARNMLFSSLCATLKAVDNLGWGALMTVVAEKP